jgi:hypothetical protein
MFYDANELELQIFSYLTLQMPPHTEHMRRDRSRSAPVPPGPPTDNTAAVLAGITEAT